MTRLIVDVADFIVGLVAVLFLLTCVGCGSERPIESHAAEPRPEAVAIVEVCTVTFLEGGQVLCTCEEKP